MKANAHLLAVLGHEPTLHLVGALEDVFKDRFVLFLYNGGHVEVSLQLVKFVAHLHREVGHFSPVLHLVEESHETNQNNGFNHERMRCYW